VNPSHLCLWCSWGKHGCSRSDLGALRVGPGWDSWPADTQLSRPMEWTSRPCGSLGLLHNPAGSFSNPYSLASSSDCSSRRRGTALDQSPEPDQARPGKRQPADRTKIQTKHSQSSWLRSRTFQIWAKVFVLRVEADGFYTQECSGFVEEMKLKPIPHLRIQSSHIPLWHNSNMNVIEH